MASTFMNIWLGTRATMYIIVALDTAANSTLICGVLQLKTNYYSAVVKTCTD